MIQYSDHDSIALGNKNKIVWSIWLLYFSLGLMLGLYEGVDLNEPMYWLILFLPGMATYNVFAYLNNWVMHYGIGGYSRSDDKHSSRKLGAVVSFLIIAVFLWVWADKWLVD